MLPVQLQLRQQQQHTLRSYKPTPLSCVTSLSNSLSAAATAASSLAAGGSGERGKAYFKHHPGTAPLLLAQPPPSQVSVFCAYIEAHRNAQAYLHLHTKRDPQHPTSFLIRAANFDAEYAFTRGTQAISGTYLGARAVAGSGSMFGLAKVLILVSSGIFQHRVLLLCTCSFHVSLFCAVLTDIHVAGWHCHIHN